MAYVILYQILDYLPSQWRNLFPILFGLGAVTYALHPEGIVEWQKRRSIERLVSWRAAPAGGGLRWRCWRPRGSASASAGSSPSTASRVEVEAGEAVGLVGPNGAGKTTLFDGLNGVRHVDEGEVSFEGRRIDRLAVYERARLGIGRTFQRLELFAGMSPPRPSHGRAEGASGRRPALEGPDRAAARPRAAVARSRRAPRRARPRGGRRRSHRVVEPGTRAARRARAGARAGPARCCSSTSPRRASTRRETDAVRSRPAHGAGEPPDPRCCSSSTTSTSCERSSRAIYVLDFGKLIASGDVARCWPTPPCGVPTWARPYE